MSQRLVSAIAIILCTSAPWGVDAVEPLSWGPFRPSVSPADRVEAESVESEEGPNLVLVAFTNDLDSRADSASPAFWCRDVLGSRIFEASKTRTGLVSELDLQFSRLGVPASLTGGRTNSRPERLVLVVCDRQFRLLAFCVGIPTSDQLLELVEDASANLGSLQRTPGDPFQTREFALATVRRRLNRYYGQRIDRVMEQMRRAHASKGIRDDRGRISSPVKEGVAKVDGKENLLNVGPDRDAPDREVSDREVSDRESMSGNKDADVIDGEETEVDLNEIEASEWEDPKVDRAWLDELDRLRKGADGSSQDPERLVVRLSMVDRVFTPLYQMDAFSRFADSEAARGDVGFWTKAMVVLEQHAEAKRPWCLAVTPLFVGVSLDSHWREIVERAWHADAVRQISLSKGWQDWINEHAGEGLIVLDLKAFGMENVLRPSKDETPDQAPGRKRTSRRASWTDVDTLLDEFPRRDVSLEELAAMQKTGMIEGMDVQSPTAMTQILISIRNAEKGGRSKTPPYIIRRGDSPARHVGRLRRMLVPSKPAGK
ncbi:MAG: hypothetical protein AAF989_15935 [Planctomycetota bacterium]